LEAKFNGSNAKNIGDKKLMLVEKKQGFTLLEVVVAMAIFSICVAMGLGVMAYALEQKVVNTAVLSIQDAFATASTTMVEEIKAASWPDYTGMEDNAFILKPENATITDELIFLTGTPGAEYRIKYSLDTTSQQGATRILKQKDLVTSTNTIDPSNYPQTDKNTDPVTPYIKQLVTTVNFINNNGKITIIMKAKLGVPGQSNDISYVATAYIRNYVPVLPLVVEMQGGTISGPLGKEANEMGQYIGVVGGDYSYTATFSGGQAPYIYVWSDGETVKTALTTATANNYSWTKPGTYTPMVTVTDAFGRSHTVVGETSITLEDPIVPAP
jgi:prepilin-type N-terminal cleavage/methylation domain-containing protein